ncbi:MAG: cation-transporting P-type ATPase, partial [Candidatus Poribacteria bacterium]|nr:cation-transporting P-type ATPase [Candidatus Poribacteria bacterium]
MSDWYKQNIPYILRELVTDLERGLSKEEAKLRIDQYGENLIDRPKQLLLIRNFFAQFRNLTVFSLLVMVAVFVVFRDSDQFRKSLQLDSSNDAVTVAIAIGGILVFQILWRFIEEVRLASQIETIRDRCEVSVSVIRDGNETRIPPTAVVPGDILILIEGDYISADARLVDADNLVVDESYLFGRAALSEKISSDLQNQTLRLEDWTNMVFGGTYVISGQGYAIAVATGEQLAINDSNHKIPREIEMESEAETEVAGYYKQFRNFGMVLAIVLLGILMFQHPVGWAMYLLVAAALIIASIPEGISLTTRRIMGGNVYDISEKSVLVREPWRLERLSCMDSVCVNDVGISGNQNFTLSSVFVDGQFVDRTMWEGW